MNTYYLSEGISAFKKVKETWGEFSNMSPHPLNIKGIEIRTSEALYQALRYPNHPEIQMEILNQKSPMAAKMKSKPHRLSKTHQLFNDNQIAVMEWCVRMKVAQNYFAVKKAMSQATTVVEISHKDQFWGAVPTKADKNILCGENVLGQIWDRIIADFKKDPKLVRNVKPLNIKGLTLLGQNINFEYKTC